MDDGVLLAEDPDLERADRERLAGLDRDDAAVVLAELLDDGTGRADDERRVRVEPGTHRVDVEVVGVLVGDEHGVAERTRSAASGVKVPGSMTRVAPSRSRTTVAWLYFVNCMAPVNAGGAGPHGATA